MKIENNQELNMVFDSLFNLVDDVFGYSSSIDQYELNAIYDSLKTIHERLGERIYGK